MPAAPAILYATGPAQWGVTVTREPQLFRLTVPPIPSWRLLHPGYWIAAGILLTLMLPHVVVAPRRHWQEVFFPILNLGIPLSWVLARAWVRMHRRLTFTVTADTFTINTRIGGGVGRTDSWPRSQIGSAHRNVSTRQLVVRITGRDLRDVYLSPSREVVEFVCAELAKALAANYLSPAPAGVSPSVPATRRVRRSFPKIAWLLGPVAVALFLLTYFVPWILLAGIAAAIPLGIYFGTQNKEYWP